eukprot:6192752-Pleurochrysis_carterae.AAC.1
MKDDEPSLFLPWPLFRLREYVAYGQAGYVSEAGLEYRSSAPSVLASSQAGPADGAAVDCAVSCGCLSVEGGGCACVRVRRRPQARFPRAG